MSKNEEKKLKKALEKTDSMPNKMFGDKEADIKDLPNLEWEEKENAKKKIGIKPIINALLLLVEEEKKLTIKKLEDAKKLLEDMKKNR